MSSRPGHGHSHRLGLLFAALLSLAGAAGCLTAPAADEPGAAAVAESALVTDAGVGQACVTHGYSNCRSGLMCDHGPYNPPACAIYYQGTCVDPAACKPILAGPPGSPPLKQCGCNGVTYPDSCARLRAGVELFKFGPC